MNKEQAIEVIEQLARGYKGTLSEHEIIQKAIQVLKDERPENDNRESE